MFSPKKALGIGLASASLIGMSGCAGLETETLGGSVVSPKGECISGKTWLELEQQQEVYLGGDVKVDSANGVQDSLKLQNAGKGVLEVVRSPGDEGTVSFPSNGAQVAPSDQDGYSDSPPSTDFSFDLSKIGSVRFNYGENATTLVVDAMVSQGGSTAIDLEIKTSCAK